ncbi:MAG: undecaprenyldiphospho-muramoylpentapeptide beta-N-acetylglucosaminyltransferase [Candidatus Omnitrophica bacterium]|nr:undecaprenyldiphospho-muramoylpentapeptide beta-N-acetylglucosaminyltransferase [Candidatus Omnitrophota bacterium]
MRILIAAGGSGGHIFPAIALATRLSEGGGDVMDIKFIGSNKALDRRIFEKEGVKFSLLSMNRLPYRITFGLVIFFIKLVFDILKSFFIVLSYRPDVVVGFGGYVSVPVIFSSYILGLPVVVHEQNVVPGRANRLLFKMADMIAISFKETVKYIGSDKRKVLFTGNPIRPVALKDTKEEARLRLGLDKAKFTILVIGGSQGAHALNETFIKALHGINEKTKEFLQVIHITGTKDYEWALKKYEALGLGYRVHSFIDRIEEAYSASDLIVTRSGASAIFEIAFFGRPMILVPYPFAMSHQLENARVFSQNGAAIEIDESDLSAASFKDNILNLVNDTARLNKMAESAHRLSVAGASRNLRELVLNLAGKR